MSILACPDQPTADDVCSEASCRRAYTHPITCNCSCGGAAHGSAHTGRLSDPLVGAAMFAARVAHHGGDVFSLMGATDADEDFAPAPSRAARVARMAVLDDEEAFA